MSATFWDKIDTLCEETGCPALGLVFDDASFVIGEDGTVDCLGISVAGIYFDVHFLAGSKVVNRGYSGV